MLNSVSNNLKIQWETFSKTQQQKWDSEYRVSASIRTVSEPMIPIILSNSKFRMFRYLDENNVYKIGYGYGNPEKRDGYTEVEAYSEWISALKKKEEFLQRQIPIALSQSQFDAILSLYFLTGNWKTIVGSEGTYNLLNPIRSGDWATVADMLSNATENRDQRMREARIIMIGDYTNTKTRTWIRNDGIQYTRTQYASDKITDILAKKQAEIAYYRQTNGAFLPNMNELKKREIINRYS